MLVTAPIHAPTIHTIAVIYSFVSHVHPHHLSTYLPAHKKKRKMMESGMYTTDLPVDVRSAVAEAIPTTDPLDRAVSTH